MHVGFRNDLGKDYNNEKTFVLLPRLRLKQVLLFESKSIVRKTANAF